MQSSIQIFSVNQVISYEDLEKLEVGRNDICFFRFAGGNLSETQQLSEQLYHLKSLGLFLVGIFRFPFRFEGKRRLQTAIVQYHLMKELCHAITYIQGDGMLELIDNNVSMGKASQVFNWVEESPIRIVEDLLRTTGQVNIDVQDIKTFLSSYSGVNYIRTFEGNRFDEPLKYVLDAPYLPEDYTEGQQILINIGCSQDVPMDAFQQISLRLNDLFHKCDLFKLGTCFLAESDSRFKITLLVNGIRDPYPRPQPMRRFQIPRLWLRKQLSAWKGVEIARQSSSRMKVIGRNPVSLRKQDETKDYQPTESKVGTR